MRNRRIASMCRALAASYCRNIGVGGVGAAGPDPAPGGGAIVRRVISGSSCKLDKRSYKPLERTALNLDDERPLGEEEPFIPVSLRDEDRLLIIFAYMGPLAFVSLAAA